jgi:hypothetical protein
MAHGERSQTNRAEAHFFGVSRYRREHGDRFQAGFVYQTVAKPYGFEDSRLFGRLGRFDQLIDIREPEQSAAIRQTDTPFYR